MLFRIIGAHIHRAELRGEAFTCVGKITMIGERAVILWSVYRGDALLKDDCRTLNEAKKLCREAAQIPLAEWAAKATAAAQQAATAPAPGALPPA